MIGTIRHLKLEVFSLKKDEQGLEDILKTSVSILRKHSLPMTIRSCAAALCYCAEPQPGSPQVFLID